MKIGSLFDGSGGFPLAASMCGIEPVWASEIEPYPIAVTRSRFPNMKHLGSVTDIRGDEIEPVDVITFGSPCQDLSVAGKRAGLKHTENGDDETTRSGLFMEAVRIIKEMRKATNGEYPRYAIWENVPGAFSSNKGLDFRVVLEELIRIAEPTAIMPEVPKAGWAYSDVYCGDGWSLAYRVLDAQYWGVPQRRRRIYLVADFRGQRAGKISFEREGLRGYLAESGTQRKAVAGDAENCVGATDREGKCYGISSYESNAMKSNNPHSGIYEAETARTLDLNGGNPACNQGGIAVVEPIGFDGYNSTDTGDKAATLGVNCGMSTGRNGVCIPYTLKIRGGVEVDSAGKAAGKGALIQENMSATLAAAQDQYLFQPIAVATQQGGAEISENGICPTVTAAAGMSGNNQPWVALIDSIGGQAERGWVGDVAPTLKASHYKFPPSVAVPCVMEPVTLEPGIASREGGHIYDGVCGTLRANAGDNQMAVAYAAGFKELNSAKARSDGFEQEKSPCLAANKHDACVVYSVENHPADSRVNVDDSGKVQTLTSRMGTGGGNVPMVMEPIPIHDQATRFSGKRGDNYDGKGNGLGVGESGDPMNTLTSGDRHAVAYAMQGFGDYKESNAASGMKARDYKDATDLVVCVADHVTPKIDEEGVSFTLNARDYKDPQAVVYEQPIALDRAFYNQGQNALYDPQFYTDGTVPTLVAKDPGAVAVRYIVRRLTPTECARLQGFPDAWGHPDIKESLTDEEYAFWLNVRNTHAAINGKATKEYTREQMLTWYNKLHTDSSEYKLWGNGIALPCALYVMQGIAEVSNEN